MNDSTPHDSHILLARETISIRFVALAVLLMPIFSVGPFSASGRVVLASLTVQDVAESRWDGGCKGMPAS